MRIDHEHGTSHPAARTGHAREPAQFIDGAFDMRAFTTFTVFGKLNDGLHWTLPLSLLLLAETSAYGGCESINGTRVDARSASRCRCSTIANCATQTGHA